MLLDKATVNLETALEARIAALRNGQFTTIVSMMLVIGFAAWLGTVVVRATQRDIAALEQSEEAQRLYAGELEVAVGVRTQELRAANAQLEAASRHKSEFLSHISHELRTPLNVILGFSELLRNPATGSLNEQQSRYLTHIWTGGKHLLVIINDLLDLAKVEAGKLELRPEVFLIDTALMAALADIQPMADQKRLILTLNTDTDGTPLTADPVRFKQILHNLLSNAVKFTPEGGHITVTARRGCRVRDPGTVDDPGSGSTPSAPESEEFVEIAVADTGIGIAADNMAKLFQPFTQLHSNFAKSHHGTGLGLALTKKLVELHNGRIWVTSEGKGRGSSFMVRFPLALRARPDETGHGE